MVIQNKKTREIRICVNLWKMNNAYVNNPFPTPFTYEILENMGGEEIYSFIDVFLSFHRVKIAKEDCHKATFMMEWGLF